MKFFSDFKNSIYNPAYYQELKQTPFSKSLKYFIVFAILCALINTVYYGAVFIPKMKVWVDQLESEIIKNYPKDLEIKIKNGAVSINQPEPYVVKSFSLDSQDAQSKGLDLRMDNILVIDTQNKFSLEQFKNYNTSCWLGRNTITCLDNNGTVKISDLTKTPDFTLNQSVVTNFFGKISPWVNFIYPLFAVMFLVGFLFIAIIGGLFHLLFGALIIWVIASFKKIDLGYKKAYALGLHLITLPALVNLVWAIASDAMGLKNNTIPFLFTIILIVVTTLNLKREENSASAPTASLT